MVVLNLIILPITVKVNGLNTPIKKQIVNVSKTILNLYAVYKKPTFNKRYIKD